MVNWASDLLSIKKSAGFVVLGWYDGGSRSFYCLKPVTGLSDLANRKIRVLQSEVFIQLIKQLNAQSVALPFKEVFAGLESGKIDCAENNLPSYESTNHYKLAKYVYVTNHVISPEALVVSTKLWDSLSASDKSLFLEAGKKSALYMRELWTKRTEQALEFTTKAGSTFTRLRDPASIIQRLGPLYGKYMSDPTTREELLTIIADQ